MIKNWYYRFNSAIFLKMSNVIDEQHETEDTVSFVDVLEREQELEENANAVLGACDDKNCSYSLVSNNFLQVFILFHLFV